MAIANALSCRTCVCEEGGKVMVSTFRPAAVLGLFEADSSAPSLPREAAARQASSILCCTGP